MPPTNSEEVTTAATPTATPAPTAAPAPAPASARAPKPLVPATALPALSQFNRLDESDLVEATKLGLLREHLPVSVDAGAPEFGIAYEKKGGTKAAGCGADVFSSQRSLQERCKQFAMQRGFQLFVSGSSTRANGGGNVKYRCKKLNGQQFFDPDTPASKLQCPFYINGYGKDTNWKITRACFLHNHYKFIGWRAAPPRASAASLAAAHAAMPPGAAAAKTAASSITTETLTPQEQQQQQTPLLLPSSHEVAAADAAVATQRVKSQRNTTMSMKALCRMVTDEVSKYPAANVMMAKLDGKTIRRILLGQGHTINHMMASRIKRQLQEARISKRMNSFRCAMHSCNRSCKAVSAVSRFLVRMGCTWCDT
ncbi:hypothetical protein PR002_g12063 [Phytophthora rubi]|uniref:Uncharacterized protein n=1 Tax=Phytophthora rubi TaxID=129364 RepID=A0A6A3LVL8_9STRA|nr:hypothetical protein PR002_g12063 [Phytophthora rubi]